MIIQCENGRRTIARSEFGVWELDAGGNPMGEIPERLYEQMRMARQQWMDTHPEAAVTIAAEISHAASRGAEDVAKPVERGVRSGRKKTDDSGGSGSDSVD